MTTAPVRAYRSNTLAMPFVRMSTAQWLASIVVVSTLVRGVLAVIDPAPWIIPDEFIYFELGRGVLETGSFELRGEAFNAWSFGPLYALLTAPAHLLSPQDAYRAILGLNAVVFSLAALPAYALARRVVSRRLALIAAGMAVLVPSGIYVTKVMTESLAYPVFLLAALAMTAAIERPTRRRQVLALGAIALATLCRAQMAVLFPALVTVAALGVLLEARDDGRTAARARFRAHWPLWVAVGMAGAVTVAAAAGDGGRQALGLKVKTFGALELAEAPKWFLFHVAELGLYMAVIPVVALVVVVAGALRRHAPAQESAFALVTASTALWLLALIAVYATQDGAQKIQDRYLFYVVPLCVIALLLWIEQGLPRPRRLTYCAAVIAAALPAVLPYETLLNGRVWGVSSATVGLVLWYAPSVFVPSLVFVGIVLTFTGLMARRSLKVQSARGLVVPVAFVFVAAGIVTHGRSQMLAAQLQQLGEAGTIGWVDEVAGSEPVALVWPGKRVGGDDGYFLFNRYEFYNGSISRVFYLDEPLQPQLTERRLSDGRLPAGLVLTDARVPVDAPVVRSDRQTGLVLYRVPRGQTPGG